MNDASDTYDSDRGSEYASLAAGTMVSHYRIERLLGSGGMGEVYLAEDRELKRKAAIKFLAAALTADAEQRARFTREAEAAASLNHPNVVTIFEVGEHRGRPFFAMEYIEGRSLHDILQDGEMAIDEVIDIADQICQGLKEAHEAGLVHRDIKPGNIVLDNKGRVRILDFGLVRTKDELHLTRAGSTLGTLKYLSPEQISGREVTAASDLFSLGVLLYQMVTEQLPFEGEYEAAVMYAIVNDTPKAINQVRADVPQGLADIITRLLEKDVSNRYHSAGDVLADLQQLGDEHVPARRRQSLRRRYLYAGGLLVLVVVVLALSWPQVFERSQMTVPQKKMLAVLPFENLGPPEHEYFSDGMTDAITTHLAKFSDLGVISRTSSMLYKNSQMSLRAIGDELGATYVLTGAVHWEKTSDTSRVKINANLVKVADDSYLWADSYERVLGGIFALQSEIAQSVTRALNIAIREDDRLALAAVPTENLEAYDYYLRGSDYFNRSWEREDIEIAVTMFEQAITLDSCFALAHAMLARGHASMFLEYYDHTDQRCRQARLAAETALRLQSSGGGMGLARSNGRAADKQCGARISAEFGE